MGIIEDTIVNLQGMIAEEEMVRGIIKAALETDEADTSRDALVELAGIFNVEWQTSDEDESEPISIPGWDLLTGPQRDALEAVDCEHAPDYWLRVGNPTPDVVHYVGMMRGNAIRVVITGRGAADVEVVKL